MSSVEVRQYQTAEGRNPFGAWLDRLRDGQARARIAARIDRMQAGLRGDKRTQKRDIEVAHGY